MENKKVSIFDPNVCSHPNLRPTDWDQPRPEPVEMYPTCMCGKRRSCTVCGWGTGGFPCSCEMEAMKNNPYEYDGSTIGIDGKSILETNNLNNNKF